jgi:polyhydroxyalkanoate synthesis repressor PhaR
MGEPRLLKKYPNRRLYDTHLSRYVTVADVRALIDGGTRPRIVEQRSGRDITCSVLLQVVADLESAGQSRLSEDFLNDLIRSYALLPAEATRGLLEAQLHAQLAGARSDAPQPARA